LSAHVVPTDPPISRAEAVAQLKQCWAIVSGDIDRATKYCDAAGTPYARRALVRTFFAAVEAVSFQLRQVTLASAAGMNYLSPAEVMLLREQRYLLDDKGQPKIVDQFLRFPNSLLLSLQTYAKNHGATFKVDKSTSGWQALKRAIRRRHNVTHPKSLACLTVSDADVQDLTQASQWWQDTLMSLFEACAESDAYWRQRQEAER
jgi:hypothetical protein